MAAEHNFILDLATVLGASALGGYVANRLRQPVLLGYLVSGLLVGPKGLGLLTNISEIKSLAEIGIVLLLFDLGIEFSLKEIKRFKDLILKGSFLQIGLTIALVAFIAIILGWVREPSQGIFLGAVLSLSSTAVVIKTLMERGETNTSHGQVMRAMLIAQDLSVGLMLAVLPALKSPEDIGLALLGAVLKALVFLAFAAVAGRWLVPPLIKNIARTESSELFLLTVIALCLGVALISDRFGISIELGAFIAGLMISEIDYADQALAKLLPLRDTFASLFFASIGMLIAPEIIIQNFGTILGLVALAMLGKAAIIFPIVIKFGYSFKTAFTVSFGLNQIGEFSFVLAGLGLELGFIGEERYLLLLGTIAISLVLTPVWMRWSPRLADELAKLPFLANYLRQFRESKALSVPETIRNHVVVAGYGRVGQVIVNILQNQGHNVLVMENSEAAIQELRQREIPYIFGDAHSELVLENAHLEKAKALAIALPDPASTRLLLKRALEFAPELDIVARSHKNSEIDLLTQLGAREVVQPEFEAALEIGAHLLGTLGETEWQIQSAINAIRTNRYLSIRPEGNLREQQEDLRDVEVELHGEWVTLADESPLYGMSLAVADIRNLTGTTIMTIQQGSQTIHYPKGKIALNSQDRLLAIGSPEELAAFRDLIAGRCIVGEGDRHWVTLAESSILIDTKPEQLENQYNVTVQAVRRHGKLYSAAQGSMKLKPEDCLLLQGNSDRLEQLTKLADPS